MKVYFLFVYFLYEMQSNHSQLLKYLILAKYYY